MATPNLDHIPRALYEQIYEPAGNAIDAEDTFLFLDALEQELDFLKALDPRITLEIGPGSGCVSTFLGQHLYTCRLI